VGVGSGVGSGVGVGLGGGVIIGSLIIDNISIDLFVKIVVGSELS